MNQPNSLPTPEPALYIPPASSSSTNSDSTPPSPSKPQQKSKKGMAIGLFVAMFLFLTGGAYAAAYFEHITLPISLPGIKNDIIAKALEDWLANTTSETTSEIKIDVETRDTTIPTIFPAANANTNDGGLGLGAAAVSLDILPDFISLNSATTAYVENTGGLGIGQIATKFDLTFGETKAKVDAEVRLLEKKLYLKVNELSGIPNIDATKLLGKWVETDLDEATSLVPATTDEGSVRAGAEVRQALQEFLTIAQEKKLFKTKKNFGKEDLGGTSTRHTSHTIYPKNFVPFFEAWLAARKKAGQAVNGANEMLAELKKPASTTLIENLSKTLTIDLWYDTAAKRIKQTSVRLVIVPPAESAKFKDDQFVITVISTINSVGVKKTVEVPTPTESLDSIFGVLSLGSSNDTTLSSEDSAIGTDAARKSDIALIRTGLVLFFDDTNSYPTTLSQLVPDYIATLPVDPVSKQAYTYLTCEKNHFLLYTKLDKNGNTFYYDDAGNSGETEIVPTCGVATGTLPTNANTNTSSEPDPGSLTIDTDNDGLEDFLEALYGTDANNPDTDGDGFKDGEEVDNGYNPKGSGKLSDL